MATPKMHLKNGTMQDILHNQILLLLESSMAMNNLIDHYPSQDFKFSNEDYAQFQEMTWTYLRLYTSLAKTYMQGGYLLFDVTIKCHYLAHMMMQAEWLNPRLTWTFAGEDFMHFMKLLAQSCVRGTRSPKVAAKILSKYRFALELRLARAW